MRVLPLLAVLAAGSPPAEIEFLDERFQLPPGFRIYRYASKEVAPGGYSIAFDGEGRVYVGGDGVILRLIDRDGDGVAEASERVAEGLGKRCPQGLLVVGRRIYAASDRGLVILEDGKRRTAGGVLRAGGDHGTHALVRGLDGFIYFAAGNGSGAKDRSHITEDTSICRSIEGGTIFRIDPDGRRWEAWGTGGRNFYGFAMDEMGEAFLVDSDGEWHYALPHYGSVRFWHSPPGADRGWRDHAGEGCRPEYWPDVYPSLADLGRGSPSAAVFYEHSQFPEPFRGAFLSGDYMWKRTDNNTHAYVTSGRILWMSVRPRGAGYESSRPATLAEGRAAGAGFAVLDLAVAPDGSLLVTGHDEGVYRLFYDPERKGPGPLVPKWPEPTPEELLSLPQPEEEWSRAREETVRAALPDRGVPFLTGVARDPKRPLAQRLRAIRLLAPGLPELPADDPEPAVRAQAAWILGLRGDAAALALLAGDPDPLVRRRALEGLARHPGPVEPLLAGLGDAHRPVRHAALRAIERIDPDRWAARALAHESPVVRANALLALATGRHAVPVTDPLRDLANQARASGDPGLALDALRLSLLHGVSLHDAWLNELLRSDDYRLVREAARVAGRFKLSACLPWLVRALDRSADPTQQFHLVKTIVSIEDGWTPELADEMVAWLNRSDEGPVSEPRGKGFNWTAFWREMLVTFARRHPGAMRKRVASYFYSGAFGAVALEMATDGKWLNDGGLAIIRKRRDEALRKRAESKDALVGRIRTDDELSVFLLGAKGGDAARGARVFTTAGCAACHTAGGGGRVLGPDLAQSLKDKPVEHVVESIVDPSAKIEEKYKAWIVVTKDDQFLQGFLSEETPDEVVLVDGARPLRIPRKSIDRMRASDLSAMPAGLANRLTDAELRDLLAFLRAPARD